MDMTNIDALCKESGITYAELERATGIGNGVIRRWRTAKGPRSDLLLKVANYFSVSQDYICGKTKQRNPDSFNNPVITGEYVTFPILGEVAAGYEHIAYESWDNGNIDIPESWLRGKSKDEYFVLKVRGDSMYPHYQDGDLVLVLRQNKADYSGQVVVALYDNEYATVKRIELDPNGSWLRLSPINQQYPSRTFRGEEINGVQIQGVPKKLIRDIAE